MPRRILDYPLALAGWHSLASAGHLLSIAGITCFFIMLFDSIRRRKAAIRNTFGIGRYNTRLNFYLYEISRLNFFRTKTLSLFSSYSSSFIILNEFKYKNFESFETTIFYYMFEKRSPIN